ncbi:MAG TPA: alpha/beta hydrolase [Alphaproteobacteria bacterium]|nr:alpha/beta hydrolase [Alphaproteobacteria bacterium]
MFVAIHGMDQWVTIRGSDVNNPVLLMLHGTGFALSAMAPFFALWEKDFTIAQWDQPGAGATFAKNGEAKTGPLSLGRIARDGLAVTEFVGQRLHFVGRGLHEDKVILLGLSGGSMVGLKMVKLQPKLFSAYVGSGQFVNWSRQDALGYAMALERARTANDAKALAELGQIGAPPYQDAATDAIKSKYVAGLTTAEQAVFASLDPSVMAAMKAPPADAHYIARELAAFDPRAQALAAYISMRAELTGFDARKLGLKFEVPMFFFQGEDDAYSVTREVEAYEAEIQAPTKMFVAIKGGGHSAFFLRDEFLRLLARQVRPVAVAK